MVSTALATSAESGAVKLSTHEGVLVVSLDPAARFEALRQSIRDVFSKTPEHYQGQDGRLDLDTRSIDLFDLRRIVHLLRDEFGVTITALYCTSQNLTRFAERELKLKVYTNRPGAPAPAAAAEDPRPTPAQVDLRKPPPRPPAPEVDPDLPELKGGGERLLTIDRSLRSGQKIHFDGDVMIFGDVNPGAEVIASGNILVFGALKGMAHAGARGEESAVIVSFDFRPTQLRIGRKIALPPDQIRRNSAARVWSPEIAWIQGGQIVIEPYQGRLPR